MHEYVGVDAPDGAPPVNCLRALQASIIECLHVVSTAPAAVAEILAAAERGSAAAVLFFHLGATIWTVLMQFELHIRCLYYVYLAWCGGVAAALAQQSQSLSPGSAFVVKRDFGAGFHSGFNEEIFSYDDFVCLKKHDVDVIISVTESHEIIAWMAWSPSYCINQGGCEVCFESVWQSHFEQRGDEDRCDACRHLQMRCNTCRGALRCREHYLHNA